MDLSINKNILIVGGSGFIGTNLTNLLCKRKNLNITCLSKSIQKKSIIDKNIEYLSVDLNNFSELHKKIKKKYNYVINLSGYIDHGNFFDTGFETIKNHFNGLINLVKVIDKSRLEHFIQISSSDTYGLNEHPQDETMIDKPRSPYAFAKSINSKFLEFISEIDHFPHTIIQIFIVYGGNQKKDRLIPYVINKCLNNQDFDIFSPNLVRDFCYIDDITNGIFEIIGNPKCIGQKINLASGKPLSVEKVVKIILDNIKLGKPKFHIKKNNNLNENLYADISKIKKLINWKPKIEIHEGIERTINWYKKNDF